jgi:hypothetical protein
MRHDTTKEESMPQIIVTADRGAAFGGGAVMLRERVTVADLESEHFATQLVERLGWAVADADEVERVGDPIDDPLEADTDPVEPLTVPSPA